jgi:hypothetical protein
VHRLGDLCYLASFQVYQTVSTIADAKICKQMPGILVANNSGQDWFRTHTASASNQAAAHQSSQLFEDQTRGIAES